MPFTRRMQRGREVKYRRHRPGSSPGKVMRSCRNWLTLICEIGHVGKMDEVILGGETKSN